MTPNIRRNAAATDSVRPMSDNPVKRLASSIPWKYIIRRTLYCVPVYLGILLLLMLILRVRDPVPAFMGKNASEEEMNLKRQEVGLDLISV